MRLTLVLVLCVVSSIVAAGIDHYWEDLIRFVQPKQAEAVQTILSATQPEGVEVLGDRVRCDVRFTELHLQDSEYRSFFDPCMGSAASGHARVE
jgi:hypothetical protein